ncbi:MAG: LEA type 2 family protein [Bacteroidota bacterium]
MKKSIKITLFLVLLLAIAGGVYFFLNPKKALNIIVPEIDQVENISVKFVGDTAKIDVDLRMQNKGFFKLNIDSLVYYVNFDSATLLAKAQYLNIELKPGQEDTLQLPLDLPYKRLMKKIQSVQDRDSVDIRIDVRIVYATVFGQTTIPYSKKMRIEVPHPPKLEFEKMEFIKREGKTLYLLAHVKLLNYSNISLNVSDIRYRLVVKDLLTATGTENKEIRVKPATTYSLALPIKVELKSIFKTLGLIVTDNDKVKYHLVINAMVQNDKVGSKKTPLEIEKDGIMELKK